MKDGRGRGGYHAGRRGDSTQGHVPPCREGGASVPRSGEIVNTRERVKRKGGRGK